MPNPFNQPAPKDGFSSADLFTGALTDGALVGASFTRRAGMLDVGVEGTITISGGSGEVDMILEGSNDNSNFVTLGSLGVTNLFDTTGQLKVLNLAGAALVDTERWLWLRVRAVIISGAPTFSLAVQVSGLHHDSQRFLITEAFNESTGLLGTTRPRPSGTKLTNVQATMSSLILGGATSVDLVLQGRLDGSSIFEEIGRIVFTGNGAAVMTQSGLRLVDLGPYSSYRLIGEEVGGAATTFSLTGFMTLDSVDWMLSGGGSGGSGDLPAVLDNALLHVLFGTPGVEGGNTRTVPFQVVTADGSPLPGSRTIEFIVYDTTLAGDLDLASTATFSAVGGGASDILGLTTNRVLVTTAADGQGTIDILDAATETVFMTGVQPRAPLASQQLVWQADEVAVAFA